MIRKSHGGTYIKNVNQIEYQHWKQKSCGQVWWQRWPDLRIGGWPGQSHFLSQYLVAGWTETDRIWIRLRAVWNMGRCGAGMEHGEMWGRQQQDMSRLEDHTGSSRDL